MERCCFVVAKPTPPGKGIPLVLWVGYRWVNAYNCPLQGKSAGWLVTIQACFQEIACKTSF